MLEWVKALEGKTPASRRELLEDFLRRNDVPYTGHEYKLLGIRGQNLVASFGQGPEEVLVTAHYDSVPGSPGANDNASSLAVLLKLCLRLKDLKPGRMIKAIFFDGEEAQVRIGALGWGLWGSRAYLRDFGCENVRAVYNLEWCGEGDLVGLWPVTDRVRQTDAFRAIKKVLDAEGHSYDTAVFPPMVLTSDHRSFRCQGIDGAFSVSLLPGCEADQLRRLFSNRREMVRFLLASRRGRCRWSSLFRRHHTSEDCSRYLSEESLQMTFDIMSKTVAAWA